MANEENILSQFPALKELPPEHRSIHVAAIAAALAAAKTVEVRHG